MDFTQLNELLEKFPVIKEVPVEVALIVYHNYIFAERSVFERSLKDAKIIASINK